MSGPRNPKSLGPAIVALHECSGQVTSIADFAKASRWTLARHERSVVDRVLDRLPSDIALKPPLDRCLCRADGAVSTPSEALMARRSGARSAYLEKERLKLKGCRPVLDGATYPIEVLPFGARRIERGHLPFGVLSREAVMREILAYAFHLQSSCRPHAVPVCVYEYSCEDAFCLLLRTEGEERVEELVEYPEMTVRELRQAIGGDIASNSYPLGSELRLHGLNLWWYVEAKSRLLIDMHALGGFRGILNSNIGNDIVIRDSKSSVSALLLCDFDSFHIVEVPANPSSTFLEAFMLHCLIDVIKGSLSILDYLELPEDITIGELGETLAAVYFTRSSLWRAYRRRFSRHARKHGWDYSLLESALQNAIRSEAAATVLGERVLNNHFLTSVSRERGVYYPHN